MAVSRCQYYRSGFVLFVWLQKIQQLMATKYEIELSEIQYLASSLSAKECYDFYNLLSHRQTIQGKPSIYAEKVKSQEVSCVSLLTTWLTDPEESNFRSNENIELKLREIGRIDLARWVLRKINSSLKRRHVDSREINRRIEESEINNVLDGTGERIIAIPSIEEQTFTNNEHIEDQQASCIFWKIFFSSLVILLLVVLFVCFYRFVYTKLRCVCRRLDGTDDEEYLLPEQTYGTASCADLMGKISREKKSERLDIRKENEGRDKSTGENFEMSDRFSTSTEINDEIFSSVIAENQSLIIHDATELTKNNATRDEELPLESRKLETVKFPIESRKSTPNAVKPWSSLTKYCAEKKKILRNRKHDLVNRNEYLNLEKSREHTRAIRKFKSKSDDSEATKKIKSENFLALLPQKKKRTMEKGCNLKNEEVCNSPEGKSPRWISCSCNLIRKSPRRNSSISNHEKIDQVPEGIQSFGKTGVSSCCSLTGLSETYDELGMLFSQHLKQQFRPCRRKYCALTRNLKRGQIVHHDITKCRNRRKSIFGEKIIMNWDRRPACSNGNICRDTYDEYEIMRATREERDILARSIINRRKSFLDQPCLSPVPQ